MPQSGREYTLTAAVDPKASLGAAPAENLLAWQGLPGDALAGMNNPTSASQFSSPYTIDVDTGRVVHAPVAIASSKTLVSRWFAEAGPAAESKLYQRGDTLRGTLRLSLDVPLEDVMVIYDDWIYQVKEELKPGQTIRIGENTAERALSWHLTRKREGIDNHEVNTPWDAEAFDIPRILEIMMFFDAAGGESYTGLTHNFQSFVDLSQQLDFGRAVLVGRSPNERAVTLSDDAGLLKDRYDQSYTYYRFVVPVETE